jgi:ferredoxin-NADP reductase
MDISLRMVDRFHEAEDVISFRFIPERPIDYVAGQYLHYTLSHLAPDERGSERYFTIASAPSESSIMLTTRLPWQGQASSFKQALAHLEPGMVIYASGPSGRFVYAPEEPKVVFIAGGIGITPFRSMLVELAALPVAAEITLLYANRTPDIAFKPLLDALAHAQPRLNVVCIVNDPTADWRGAVGRIDAAFIAQHVPDATRPLYYVSGPQLMVKAMGQALADLGVQRNRIKRESFPGYDA